MAEPHASDAHYCQNWRPWTRPVLDSGGVEEMVTIPERPTSRALPVLEQPRRPLVWLPLGGLLSATLVMYLPALRSPFVTDDYILLRASRDMGFGAFLKSAAVPWADPGKLELSQHYWRPLSFLTFRALYAVFGTHPLPYHLFQFGVHCASVVLVYFLALRLTRTRLAATVGGVVMALDPAGLESIGWISALNSAALPAALGAWLAFISATREPGRFDWRWMALSLLLEASAFGYRETVVVIIVAMLLWYVGCERAGHLTERATWKAAAPPALLAAGFAIWLRVAPGGGNSLESFDGNTAHVFWFYVRQVVPVTPIDAQSPLAWAQRCAGVALLVLPIVALARRHWLVAALSAGLLAALVPYSVYNLGYGPRYYYFPTAVLALLAAAVVAEVEQSLPVARRWAAMVAPLAIGLVLIGGAVYGHGRVHRWTRDNPDVQQRWLSELQAQYASLPPQGALWAVNTPFPLTLFEGSSIPPALDFIYGNGPHPVRLIDVDHIGFARGVMGPNDRMFQYVP